MDKKVFTVLFFVIGLTIYSPCFAETVILKSGQEIKR